MSGIFSPNALGTPDTAAYYLGRGKAYISELVNSVPSGGWRDIGNIPGFTLNNTSETLKHQSSREGTRVTDLEVVISQEVGIGFDLDEINAENVADWLSGEKSTHTNVAIAGFAEHTMITDVVKGRWYDIVDSTGARAYDIDSADLTVEKSGMPDTALVENTDYILNTVMGMIFFPTTSVTVVDGDEIDVTLAADAGASAVTEIRALTTTTRRVALKFICENPADNDKQVEILFHQVALKADGDFALIGDEFAKMSFTATVEKNETADADAPYVRIRTFAQ